MSTTGTMESNQRKSIWAQPGNTELLVKLWDEGQSAAKIANQIPGATRNSVIGKRHRLGLPKHKQAPSQNPIRIQARKERIMPELKPQLPPVPLSPPSGKGIPFLKSGITTCRSVEGYEVNEQGHTLALFCSNPKLPESSFCPYHMAIYYRKDGR